MKPVQFLLFCITLTVVFSLNTYAQVQSTMSAKVAHESIMKGEFAQVDMEDEAYLEMEIPSLPTEESYAQEQRNKELLESMSQEEIALANSMPDGLVMNY